MSIAKLVGNHAFTYKSVVRWLMLAMLLPLIVAGLAYVFSSDSTVTDTVITEDGYLTLTIARNLAQGRGLTADGVNPTNGVQPLVLFLFAPLFKLAGTDLILPLRLVLALSFGIFVLNAYILGLIVRDTLLATTRELLPTEGQPVVLLVMVIYLGSFHLFSTYLNGLETGLALLLYTLLWRYYQVHSLDTWQKALGFGSLLGLLILARIDAGIFASVFALSFVLYQTHQGQFKKAILFVTLIGVVATVISLPWWIYNVSIFGELMPSSGKALSVSFNSPLYSSSLTERLLDAALAVKENILPLTGLTVDPALNRNDLNSSSLIHNGGFVLLIGALLPLSLKAHRRYGQATSTRSRSLEFAAYLSLNVIALIGFYTLFMESSWFYIRYFSPLALLSVAFLIAPAIIYLADWLRRPILFTGLLQIYILVGVVTLASLPILFGLKLNTVYRYRILTDYIQRRVPNKDLVMSWESGYLGYFRDYTLNMDGKVNAKILPYLAQGNILPYLDDSGVCWVVGDLNDSYAPNYDFSDWQRIDSIAGTWNFYQRINGCGTGLIVSQFQ